MWHAQYTEPPARAAAPVHRASWRSWGARGRVWGCLLRGRRSTQSLLEELRRAWAPLARGCLLACQAQYSTQSLLAEVRRAWAPPAAAFSMAGAVHRASWRSCGARGRRWPAATFCVAGAVHRAFWRSCGAHGRRWPAAAFCVAGAVHRASWRSCGRVGAAGPRLPFAWQAQYTELPGGAAARVGAGGPRLPFAWQAQYTSQLLITTHHNLSQTNSSQLHFSHLTHHSTTAHHNSSQLHFSSQLITTYHIPTHHSSTSHTSLLTPHLSQHNFSSQLITSQLITAPLLTPLLTPHLSHQNSSQLHFSHLTSQVHFSHLTSHTSPKFTLKLRYMKACHVGLSDPFIILRVFFGGISVEESWISGVCCIRWICWVSRVISSGSSGPSGWPSSGHALRVFSGAEVTVCSPPHRMVIILEDYSKRTLPSSLFERIRFPYHNPIAPCKLTSGWTWPTQCGISTSSWHGCIGLVLSEGMHSHW